MANDVMAAPVKSRAGWGCCARDPEMWANGWLDTAFHEQPLTGLDIGVMRYSSTGLYHGQVEFSVLGEGDAGNDWHSAQSRGFEALADAQEWCETMAPRLVEFALAPAPTEGAPQR